MLPSAKKYLTQSGLSPRNASFTLIGCFLVGAFGISVLSRILHQYIPHSVVDCDHEHGDEEEGKMDEEEAHHPHHAMQEQQRYLPQADGFGDRDAQPSYGTNSENNNSGAPARRPSLHTAISSKVSQLVTGAKKSCDDNGQCYGYSDTCGTECFKNVLQTRPPHLKSRKSLGNLVVTRPSGMNRNQTTQATNDRERRPLLEDLDETTPLMPTRSGPTTMESSVASLPSTNGHPAPNLNDNINNAAHDIQQLHKHSRTSSTCSGSSHASHSNDHDHAASHHHHVPQNVFMSIG
jgi:ZIP family zinc transporter